MARPPVLIFFLAMLLAVAGSLDAASVLGVRIGQFEGAARVVVEVDGDVTYRITNNSGRGEGVVVDLNGVDSAPRETQRVAEQSIVRGATLERHGERLRLALETSGIVNVSHFTMDGPNRVVVDLRLSQAKAAAPARPAAAGKAAPRNATPLRTPTAVPAPKAAAPRPASGASPWRRRIIIDPGHGGWHKGGVGTINGRQVFEKQVTIKVAEKLERYFLQDPRFEVRLTRRADAYMGLLERTLEAERLQGDLFISLHCNAVEDPAAQRRAKGFEIWTWNREANRSAAARAIERLENADPRATSAENSRLLTTMMTDALESQALVSRRVAQAIHARAVQNPYLRANDRGIDSAKFKVLEIYGMPSILVELGFMTHPEEVKLLFSEDFQELWARILYEGTIAFYERTEPDFPRSTMLARGK